MYAARNSFLMACGEWNEDLISATFLVWVWHGHQKMKCTFFAASLHQKLPMMFSPTKQVEALNDLSELFPAF